MSAQRSRGVRTITDHPQRLLVLSLSLLNALLLIAAVVVGIYCAKATDLQVPVSANTPFFIEMNYLTSNHSDMIRGRLQVQADLLRERSKHMHLVLQLKQKKMVTDVLQRQIETLHTEKSLLDKNISALEESCGRCRQGWTFFRSSCYYFSNVDSSDDKNWPDSRADCTRRGGDLVVINNMEEQVFVNNRIPLRTYVPGEWWQNGFWMGLSQVAATPGVWMWVTNATETDAQYWILGQPKHQGLQSGNCSASNHHSANHRKTWYNANCHILELRYVCETEPVQ